MSIITRASSEWSTRPADQRFASLIELHSHTANVRAASRSAVVASRKVQVVPSDDGVTDLAIVGPSGAAYQPSNWSFGQIASLAGAPAGYLRTLPAAIAADALNYGLQYTRDIEDVGLLLTKQGDTGRLRAATGPRYGRIWNADITRKLVEQFGDGVSGTWRVPGEFGARVDVTRANTTLYASDRDIFVFLADEDHKIEIPNRRNGEPGLLSRGFFVWNSEEGSKTFGIGTFLFDYVCQNRIVWGAEGYKEITLRHTVSAPDRFIEQVQPALERYANGSASNVVKAIADARNARLDDVGDFLAKRFSKGLVGKLQKAHEIEEGRPIETLWDVTTAATAVARTIEHQDDRVALERQGGEVLALAA